MWERLRELREMHELIKRAPEQLAITEDLTTSPFFFWCNVLIVDAYWLAAFDPNNRSAELRKGRYSWFYLSRDDGMSAMETAVLLLAADITAYKLRKLH